jgi:hypothetical protein
VLGGVHGAVFAAPTAMVNLCLPFCLVDYMLEALLLATGLGSRMCSLQSAFEDQAALTSLPHGVLTSFAVRTECLTAVCCCLFAPITLATHCLQGCLLAAGYGGKSVDVA